MALNEIREKSFLRLFSDFFLLGVILSFLLLSPWFYGLTRFRDQLLAEVFVFVLFALSLPFQDLTNTLQSGDRRIDLCVFLTLGVGIFYVFFSVISYQSFIAFLRLFACALFYRLVRWGVRTEAKFQFFLWAILFSGVLYSIYGLFQYYGFLPHSYWYQPDSLSSRYVNSGHFASLLLFPLYIGISLLVVSRKTSLQLVLTCFLLVMGWALLLARARAVWIAFLIGLIIFIWLLWRNQLINSKIIFGLLLFGGGGIFLLLVRGGGLGEILERLQQLGSATQVIFDKKETSRFYTLIYRWKLWEGTFAAWFARPWGWGLGTFSSVFPQYRVHSDRFFVDYAHNEFLQVGVDLGIPGILFLIGFLFSYFQTASLFLRNGQTKPAQKVFGIGFSVILINLTLVSQVDFPLRIYSTSFFFVTFLALSSHLFGVPLTRSKIFNGLPSTSNRHSQGGLLRFAIALAILVLVGFTTRQLFAQLDYEKGLSLEKDFSWAKAMVEYEKAVLLSPAFPKYQEALGSLYQTRAALSFSHDQKTKFRDRAIYAYQEAIRHQPQGSLLHYSLALLYEEKGELKRAQSEFLKAISLEPLNAFIVSEYGHFAVRHSLAEEAIAAFEEFQKIPFKEGARDSDLSDLLKSCYSLTNDYDQLKRVIPDNPDGHTHLGMIFGNKGRWELARKEFDRAMEQAKRAHQDYKGYWAYTGGPIADFYASHDHIQEALAIYRETLARNPDDTETQKKVEALTR